jgi:TonB family protein
MKQRTQTWLAGAGAAVLVLGAVYAWLWAPWHYFTAQEVGRVAYPMQDVGLQFPPGREGVDYYGTLRLDVYVDAKGHVDRVEVLESTVPAAFRDSAVRAFAGTPFDPAVRFGRPVKSVKRVEVNFAPPLQGLDPLRR